MKQILCKSLSLAIGVLAFVLSFSSTNALKAEKNNMLRNTYSDSYVGVGLRGGLAGLSATGSIDAKLQQGFVYGFDVNYVGELGRHYGFVVGLNFNFFSSGLDAGTVSSAYDGELPVSLGFGNTTDMRAHYIGTTTSVRESYTASFMEIPVLLSYSSDSWVINAGVKFAIPMSIKANYSCNETEVVLDRVLSTGTELVLGLPMDTYDGVDGSYTLFGSGGKMRSVSVMASLEFGYRLQFYQNSSLQFTLFGDCGLGTMQLNNAASDLMLTLNQAEVNYRGLLNAGDVTGLRYFKYGVRVQYNIGLGSSPRSGNPIRIL